MHHVIVVHAAAPTIMELLGAPAERFRHDLMSEADADAMSFIVVAFHIVFVIVSGYCSDRFPHRTDLVRIGLPAVIVGCPTMFGMFESESWWGILIAQIQSSACLSMVQGCMAAFEVELWMADPTLSFTGVAIGHNLSSTLFGGTMPLVATYLYYLSEDLVGEEDDDRVIGLALFFKLIQQPPDLRIHERHAGVIGLQDCAAFSIRVRPGSEA